MDDRRYAFKCLRLGGRVVRDPLEAAVYSIPMMMGRNNADRLFAILPKSRGLLA
jgi:hypothetical protein